MVEFVVIDLRSQVEALRSHLRGCTKQEIIIWLSHYGEVGVIDFNRSYSMFAELPKHFTFKSHCGLEAVFWFGNDNSLQVTARGSF